VEWVRLLAAAEGALAIARDAEPGVRMGEIDLELGRMRIAGGDLAGAREALERLVAARPGTVEGRFLLARALDGLGDGAGARRVRDEAWNEYASLPAFHRRRERRFAWRIRPWRPAAIALALAVIVAALASWAVPSMADRASRQAPAAAEPARRNDGHLRGSPGAGPAGTPLANDDPARLARDEVPHALGVLARVRSKVRAVWK
jgi:hypothetical protein